jgi:hypothetical protein
MAVKAQVTVADYVKRVMSTYVSLPGTPARPSRRDRRLARELYGRGVSLMAVRTALLLAAARRTLRNPEAKPLDPVRTLYYFLPVIEEVNDQPPDPGYVAYLSGKLQPFIKSSDVLLDSG